LLRRAAELGYGSRAGLMHQIGSLIKPEKQAVGQFEVELVLSPSSGLMSQPRH
jgi:hypothetical protein